MKRISIFALAALLCCGLALTACKGGNKADSADDYIAKTIFDLIPKEDLPDYCRHLQTNDDTESSEFNPSFFSGYVEGHMVEGMDAGFYGYLQLKCYPLKDGGWRAYWAAYGGYDGLCGFDRSGAYNYVNGKLTPEETWILPFPSAYELISQDLADSLEDAGEYDSIENPHPNYVYAFGNGLEDVDDDMLIVSLDLDYLTYGEEGDEPSISGEALDLSYRWNGERLVRLDEDALDEVQMRAIGLMMGFKPEEFHVENGGFKTFDPEEEGEGGQDVYYNYVQTYPVTDDLGMTTAWKVLNYELGTRELTAYDFDGMRLVRSKDPVIEAWNKVRESHGDAFIWLYETGLTFCEPRGDYADYGFAEYNYEDNAFTPVRQ